MRFLTWNLQIDQMIDADEFVITRFTARGTHKGSLRRIAAAKRSIQVEGIVIHRVLRGRLSKRGCCGMRLG